MTRKSIMRGIEYHSMHALSDCSQHVFNCPCHAFTPGPTNNHSGLCGTGAALQVFSRLNRSPCIQCVPYPILSTPHSHLSSIAHITHTPLDHPTTIPGSATGWCCMFQLGWRACHKSGHMLCVAPLGKSYLSNSWHLTGH